MKISEMTLEQLQDYAVQLENDKTVTEQAIKDKDSEIQTLKDLNLGLQKRNKELFLQVEQQATPPVEPPQEPGNVESLEDVVKNTLYKEIKNL